MSTSLNRLNQEIVACSRCPRLVDFRQSISKTKRKKYINWDYWGKPVPGFGDPEARLLLVGLAPAAHGGNRTGRVFTGDKSADFLVKCLYEVGLANQPNSDSMNDGLRLNRTYVTPVLKCVPPGDKPRPEELSNCFSYFQRELDVLTSVTHVVALGRIAFRGCLKIWQARQSLRVKDFPFGHGKFYNPDGQTTLVACYHPSPRNVNTGRLTHGAMIGLLKRVKKASGIG
ncbi:MAG: uracil-DNA glycosylase [Fidelibacterota bacterium]